MFCKFIIFPFYICFQKFIFFKFIIFRFQTCFQKFIFFSYVSESNLESLKRTFLIFHEMKLFYFMLKKRLFLQEIPQGYLFLHVFISSRFYFFLFSFLHVIVSSDVFIVECICLLQCFFTVVVITSATDLREIFLLSGVFLPS